MLALGERGGGMFGVGDNNQAQNGPALPPSPFMEPSAPPADHSTMQHTGSVEPVAVAPNPAPMPEPGPAPAPDNGMEPMTAPDHAAPGVSPDNDLLVGIKQQALSSLTPLVGHLDQTPEERFKTTMMLIQASDNADLVKDAYEAASQIADEKERAQALLDVVNEINYFTQKDSTDKKV